MGRPAKLTPEVQDRIVQALRIGNFREVAARWGGIDPGTFRRWMERGAREKSGRYGAFRAAVLEAETEAEMALVARWQKQLQQLDDWKAIQTFLERRYPDRWGKKHQVDINVLKRHVVEYAQQRGIDPDPLLVEVEKIAAQVWTE